MGKKESLGGAAPEESRADRSPELRERIKKTSESLSEAMERDAAIRQVFRNQKKGKLPFRSSE